MIAVHTEVTDEENFWLVKVIDITSKKIDGFYFDLEFEDGYKLLNMSCKLVWISVVMPPTKKQVYIIHLKAFDEGYFKLPSNARIFLNNICKK